MHIPLLYILISAEIVTVLLISAGAVIVYLLKKRPVSTESQDEASANTGGGSYIQFLEKELQDNQTKTQQQVNLETESETESLESGDADAESNQAEATDSQASLLQTREMFLQLEKEAASLRDNDHSFWVKLLHGLQGISDHLKTTETKIEEHEHEVVEHENHVEEKVFYIETQGKKIDTEVNKLKDIIYEQESSISSLRKAMTHIGETQPENSEAIEPLLQHINTLEQQLNDSKMCMEVLEMENQRLQEEVDKAADQIAAAPSPQDQESESESIVNLGEMQELIDKQKHQIEDLNESIDDLKLEAIQAEKLRNAINDFTRSSQEMMNCITILEEENLRLKQDLELSDNTATGEPDPEAVELNSKVSSLEEELIKKEVAYAKLHDQYAALEKQFLDLHQDEEHHT